MKIIFKIARAEFRNLFYSPVAWVILVTFFVVCGLAFATPVMELARQQQVELENSPDWFGFKGPLTLRLIGSGAVPTMIHYLYLFIPLLTMGAISREVNSGSMTLLTSSPIRIREIIAGKYLGLMLFNLVLMAVIMLLLLTAYFSVLHAEFAWYASMLLGLVLLSAAYMAIGLFISCLTNYQIMAGIATLVLFYILSVIGKAWQQYDLVRDVTWFLSITGRAQSMVRGLITTRDLMYFILIIVLFLGLALIKLKTNQESVPWTVPFSRNLAWIMIVLTIGYFSSRPGYIGYLDVTRDKVNTIDPVTQAVLKELDGSPLTVTMYANLLGGNFREGVPERRNAYIWGFWEKYIRFYPNIKLRYEYYYDVKKGDSTPYLGNPNKTMLQIAKSYARMYRQDLNDFKKPEEINKIINFGNEPLKLLMQVEYNGKKTFLRTFKANDPWPSEPNVSAAVRQLTQSRFPHLTFTTGHYERSPWRIGEREFGFHTNYTEEKAALINLGVNIDTVSLSHSDIPATTDLLVVADPKSSLDTSEQQKILQYLDKGGNAIFYAEPGKQQMLNPIINRLGVNIDNGIIVSPRKHTEGSTFVGSMTKAGNYMAKERMMQIYQIFGKGGAAATFEGISHLSYLEKDGFRIEPIVTLKGNNKTWIENGIFASDSAAPVFAPQERDVKKEEYVLAVKLSRKMNDKEQRIVITGDADFMTPQQKNGGNIGNGMYSWLMNNEYPLYTRLINPADVRLTIGKKTGIAIWYAYVYVIPGLLLAAGTLILFRRMRK